MSACSSCGAPITWCKTTKGGSMPLNPQPEPNGNIDLLDGVAHVVKAEPKVLRYTSHFANCPNANGHRKQRRR